MERYIYQQSDHMPPWAISYDVDDEGSRTFFYVTLYSDQIETATHALYFGISAHTPFQAAHIVQEHARNAGVDFTTEDFNQVEWAFSNHF